MVFIEPWVSFQPQRWELDCFSDRYQDRSCFKCWDGKSFCNSVLQTHKYLELGVVQTLVRFFHDEFGISTEHNSSIKSLKQLRNDYSEALRRGRPLLLELSTWHSTLPVFPPSSQQHSGNSQDYFTDSSASLELGYHTVQLIIFRALLRALGRKCSTAQERGTTEWKESNEQCRAAAKSAIISCHDFTSSLGTHHFLSFWAPCMFIGFYISLKDPTSVCCWLNHKGLAMGLRWCAHSAWHSLLLRVAMKSPRSISSFWIKYAVRCVCSPKVLTRCVSRF